MDSWTDKEIKAMRVGGNQNLNDFFAKYNIPKEMPINKKYNTPVAELYREMFFLFILFHLELKQKLKDVNLQLNFLDLWMIPTCNYVLSL